MSKDEEEFSLHWGLISLFGTNPMNGDSNSWGAFTDQAPYLSLGKTPFINPPLPMWAMVGWTNVFGQTLPITRTASAIVASLGLFAFYIIGKYSFSKQFSLFAPGFLAGNILWNGYARQATPDIWGNTIFLSLIALSLYYTKKDHSSALIHSIIYPLCISIMIMLLALSSFTGFGLFLIVLPLLFAVIKPSKQIVFQSILGSIIGTGLGMLWYISMDFPFWSQVIESLFSFSYSFDTQLLQTSISDFVFLPFIIFGLIMIPFSLSSIKQHYHVRVHLFFALWLCASLLCTSQYSILFIAPFIGFGISSFSLFNENTIHPKARWIILSLTCIIALYGIVPRLAYAASMTLTLQSWTMVGIIALSILLFIPLIGLLVSNKSIQEMNIRILVSFITILFIAGIVKVTFANYLGKQSPISKPAQYSLYGY